jgi:hypothetical protein
MGFLVWVVVAVVLFSAFLVLDDSSGVGRGKRTLLQGLERRVALTR